VDADTDGAVADEPGFAGAFAADVGQISPVAGDDDVGDELLEGGVVFGLGAGHKAGYAGLKEPVEIRGDIRLEAVKKAQFFHDLPFDYEYLFNACHYLPPHDCYTYDCKSREHPYAIAG
jgi:hypothetical protein